MNELYDTCEAAIREFLHSVRAAAERGRVTWHIALFVEDGGRWRVVVIYPGAINNLEAMIVWGANRMARILDASAAAFVDEGEDGAVVRIERRGSGHVLTYRLGRGERALVAEPQRHAQELLPGGNRNEGWGWQDHDSLKIDHGMSGGPDVDRVCEGEE